MQTAKCLSCSSDIIIDDEAVIGDLADCLICGAQHEIKAFHPIQLSLLEEDDSDLSENNNDHSSPETAD